MLPAVVRGDLTSRVGLAYRGVTDALVWQSWESEYKIEDGTERHGGEGTSKKLDISYKGVRRV